MWLETLYVALSSVLTGHTVLQSWLLWAARRRRPADPAPPEPASWPAVTVQLPVFNERYVVRRLLDAVAALDYPRHRLTVQVLDDSTDDTAALVAAQVADLRRGGLDVVHVRRGDRRGYKAGALQEALPLVRGEMLALFDADFVPPPDFLRRAVPRLAPPRTAVVQARWGHANRDRSLLTRIQAFFLDVHFRVEQPGRRALGCFLNFNGTAGVWRVEAIRDAGGWRADTLTEDLDLSYRAQLRGWTIEYLEDLEVPAELPDDLRAFRTQQHRWMKGVAQNAVRFLPAILRSRLPARVKLHAGAHLLESSNFPALLAVILLTPLVARRVGLGAADPWTVLNPLWIFNAVVLGGIYLAPRRHELRRPAAWAEGLFLWIAFNALSMALSLHNSLAVASGLAGRPGPFVRTPKAGDGPPIARGRYRLPGVDRVTLLEGALWLYLAVALGTAARQGTLHLMWIPALSFAGLSPVLAAGLWPAAKGAARALRRRGPMAAPAAGTRLVGVKRRA